MCALALKRLDTCNGKLSVDAVCSDRNCMVALEEAAAAANGCTGVAGFQNLPTAATLGCQADGTVAPVARALLAFSMSCARQHNACSHN